jgi:hypothetical protein
VGEHRAGAGGVQHPAADEAAVHRLVTRAAAGHQRHLALYGRVGAGDEVRTGVDADQVGMRCRHAGEGFVDDVVGRVDELLHRVLL